MNAIKKSFTRKLLLWNSKQNNRQMPWKGEKDPYKVWLSEIILQQTRVEQGINYYESFVKHFPTVEKLARAKKEKVFKLWEGLGYYQRCKNLLFTASVVANEHKGIFPSTYEGLLALKGIGPYTAAAISSFAFNRPHAVVDGNVFRVLARVFGINTPIDTGTGKKLFTALAEELLARKTPATYNQAIMDFGATVCTPQNPSCSSCVMKSFCGGHLQNKVHLLPEKEKKTAVKKRWFYYLVAENNGCVYLFKRTGGEIWENLYEFILYETAGSEQISPAIIKKMAAPLGKNRQVKQVAVSPVYTQRLTHRQIEVVFIHVQVTGTLPAKGFVAVPWQKINGYAFPRVIRQYIADTAAAKKNRS
jgi:A/G-specific adenine glycosylase